MSVGPHVEPHCTYSGRESRTMPILAHIPMTCRRRRRNVSPNPVHATEFGTSLSDSQGGGLVHATEFGTSLSDSQGGGRNRGRQARRN